MAGGVLGADMTKVAGAVDVTVTFLVTIAADEARIVRCGECPIAERGFPCFMDSLQSLLDTPSAFQRRPQLSVQRPAHPMTSVAPGAHRTIIPAVRTIVQESGTC